MTKAEFIKEVKELLNYRGIKLTESEVRAVYQAFVDKILETVAKGERLHLEGLGIFNIKFTKEKKGRNFRTGEEILIPSSVKPIFKPSARFKELVKEWNLQVVNKTYKRKNWVK